MEGEVSAFLTRHFATCLVNRVAVELPRTEDKEDQFATYRLTVR
jgi:hypothetical protein